MGVLDIAVRSSVVVLAGLALAALLRRRSAALRHLVIAIGIFGAVAVVPLSRAVPAWDVTLPSVTFAGSGPVLSTVTTTHPTATQDARVDGRQPPAVAGAASILWAAGTIISVTFMIVSGIQLWRLRRRAVPIADGHWHHACEEIAACYGLARPIAILETNATHALGTWGVWRPRILLPPQAAAWTADRARIVLWHELAHVKRADWLIQVSAELVRATFWFNPLFWFACAELRRESEHACDDSVLGAGVAAADYAAHLVDIA